MRCSISLRAMLLFLCWVSTAATGYAEMVDASVQVRMTRLGKSKDQPAGSAGVVIWLTPLSNESAASKAKPGHYRLVQKDKTFTPHLLVIPTGSSVDFPNLDLFSITFSRCSMENGSILVCMKAEAQGLYTSTTTVFRISSAIFIRK